VALFYRGPQALFLQESKMPITPKSIKPAEVFTPEHTKKALPEYIKNHGADNLLEDTSSSNLKDFDYDPEKLEQNGIRIQLKRNRDNLFTYRVEIKHDGGWKVLGNLTYNNEDHSISGPISAYDHNQSSKIKELVGKHHEQEMQKQGGEEDLDDLSDFIGKVHSGEDTSEPGLQKALFSYQAMGATPEPETPEKPKPKARVDYSRLSPEVAERVRQHEALQSKAEKEKPRPEPKMKIEGIPGNPYAISVKKADGSFSQHKLGDIREVLGNPDHPNHVSIKGAKLNGNVLQTQDGHEVKIHHPDLLSKVQKSLAGTKRDTTPAMIATAPASSQSAPIKPAPKAPNNSLSEGNVRI